MAETTPQQLAETPQLTQQPTLPSVPQALRQKPLPERKKIHDASIERRETELQEHPFLKQFPDFVKRIEQSGDFDFFGKDKTAEELRKNEIWKEMQEKLQARLKAEAETFPKTIDLKFQDEWLNKVFDRLATIIASYDETTGEMKSANVDQALEKVLGETGDPGPFMKWFKENHGKEFQTWKTRQEEALKKFAAAKEMPLQLLADQKGKIPPECTALQAWTADIKNRLHGATNQDEINQCSGDISALTLAVAEAGTTLGTVQNVDKRAAKLTLVRDVVDARVKAAREKLARATTAAQIAEANRLVEGMDDWEKLDSLLASSELAAEKDNILQNLKKPDFDIKATIARLESIRDQTEAQLATQAATGDGFIDGIVAWINKPFFGKYSIGTDYKKTIYGVLLAIVGLVAKASKSWRRNIISSGNLEHLASVTGDQALLTVARQETTAEKTLFKAGVPKKLAHTLLDVRADQFASSPPQSFSKDPGEIAAMVRVQQSLRKNNLANAQETLAVAIGSKPDFKMEAAPVAVAQKPPETTVEGPEQKTDNFLREQIAALTDEELALAKGLSAADIAKGKITKPEKFDPDRFAKMTSLLTRNHAQDKDSGITVAAFFTKKFQANEPPQGLA